VQTFENRQVHKRPILAREVTLVAGSSAADMRHLDFAASRGVGGSLF
jgi:hypothetical protein